MNQATELGLLPWGRGGEDAFTPVPLAIGPLLSGALPSWEATGTTHLAPGMVPPTAGWLCRLGKPGHIPEDTGRREDWLAPLSRWWHSQEAAPRDG